MAFMMWRPEDESASRDAWTSRQDDIVRRAVALATSAGRELGGRLERAEVDPSTVTGVDGLEAVPVLSKDRLPELQRDDPPFGGLLAVDPSELDRVFVSPGPILDPGGPGPDFWGFAPAFFAAGFREGHVVYNTFSYHLTPAGAMMEDALRALGASVVPGGVGHTDVQAEALSRTRATGFCGTPDFLWTLVERARERGHEVVLERAFVSGAPLSDSLRVSLRDAHGIAVYQGYGTADVGAIGYECQALNGWHTAPDRVVEVLEPGTGRRLAESETGEVVVTVASEVYPLVRFGTGDLSALVHEPCACGRTTPRLQGFQGRVGDGVKVRGMFVHPHSIARALEAALASRPRFRAVVGREGHEDTFVLRVEAPEASASVLADRLQAALKLRVEVELVADGELGDGPALVDERRWR